MPYYRVPGAGMVHLNLSGKARKNPPAPCCAKVPRSVFPGHETDEGKPVRCMAISTFLCDWPVEGGTCDAPLCAEHATEVGKDRHLCPVHLQQQRESGPELS
jgi:hypothetical protein